MFAIKNFGLTPANSVFLWASWGGMPHSVRLPDDFKYPKRDNVTVGGPMGIRPTWTKPTLFPDQTTEQTAPINDLIGFIDSRKGTHTMYVWGTISYVDVFKQERETDFCFVFDPLANVGERFSAYEKHNEAR